MGILNITSRDRMVDARGHPYFLWDLDMPLAEFESRLEDPDPVVRAYFLAKVMRQARPDDVFAFVTARTIRELWPLLEPHLGRSRGFWSWLMERWSGVGSDRR